MDNFQEKVSFIWSVADLLRGDYKQSEYGRVILPFTVLRRLDCVLDPTKQNVLEAKAEHAEAPDGVRHKMLEKAAGQSFYNTHKMDFGRLLDDPNNIAPNLTSYIASFSKNARDILDHFRFETQIERLERADLLYLVVQKFNDIDLHPDVVPNMEMGYIFEELIRKFSEQSNETAGEHFTPREVIRLMVNLLFNADSDVLTQAGTVRTLFDPACGTGGMMAVAEEYLEELNPDASLQVFGQELNGESYAICKSDMLIKGHDADNIKYGNSFSEDGLPDKRFDYMLSNPPFGVSWKKVRDVVEDEHDSLGHDGRFGAGTPRINDGSLLFLQHMCSKMKPYDRQADTTQKQQAGSRIGIVFNASPLFTGSAGSGESEIRKWIIENDWLEAVIGLPDQLFYNTGINTYIWIVTNRKDPERRGKIQLIDGTDFYQKMRKSLGDKRHELSTENIDQITKLYGDFEENDHSKIFDNEDFGYYRIKVERPLRENFEATPERIERLWEETKFKNLAKPRKKDPEAKRQAIEEGKERQQEIIRILEAMTGRRFKNKKAFTEALVETRKELGISKFYVKEKRAIWSALAEKDEDGDIVHDTQGRPKADSDLRDYENIPLKEDIEEYFEREVKPYVPDSWIDEDYTRVGYEIPFTRYFYEYEQPRSLEAIEKEILELEGEIQGMLNEVLA